MEETQDVFNNEVFEKPQELLDLEEKENAILLESILAVKSVMSSVSSRHFVWELLADCIVSKRSRRKLPRLTSRLSWWFTP